jgi:hypothetical protein
MTSKYVAFGRLVVPSSLPGSPTVGLLYISRNSFLIGAVNSGFLLACMYDAKSKVLSGFAED